MVRYITKIWISYVMLIQADEEIMVIIVKFLEKEAIF